MYTHLPIADLQKRVLSRAPGQFQCRPADDDDDHDVCSVSGREREHGRGRGRGHGPQPPFAPLRKPRILAFIPEARTLSTFDFYGERAGFEFLIHCLPGRPPLLPGS